MEIKTQNTREEKIELQISDAFTVESHEEVNLIVKAWQELKKKYQVTPNPSK